MADLEQRLRALEDREAIRELIASYGPLADCGAAQDAAALWSEDGRYGVAGFADATGRNEIAALINAPYHQQLLTDGCAHMLGPVAIDLADDSATARGHSVVLRWTGTAFEVLRVAANRWVLARSDSGWQVTRRDNALLQGDEAARELLRPWAGSPR
ncbi:nuclear transport factor 2 family protein [Novosphingobium sp.]|uniref:nuclear transport factor 2 family protein n=1 Tax=Novosphingobium sp. TaxID=1874826 RepID=UPI00273514FE|nr:nuclear transport factor 2 family protein [Novosphingobium sp.]MDP3907363.1 nuclear transport factor 2 family protein [Novosphingobium sp.]